MSESEPADPQLTRSELIRLQPAVASEIEGQIAVYALLYGVDATVTLLGPLLAEYRQAAQDAHSLSSTTIATRTHPEKGKG